jgi:hypothetical protein
MSKRSIAFLLMASWTAGIAHAEQATFAPCFRGEIVDAEDFTQLVVFRGDETLSGADLGRHSPLFPGDVIVVQGEQPVIIRDKPGGGLRVIGPAAGRVLIESPECCDVTEPFKTTFLALDIFGILSSPAYDPQPRTTYPVRGADDAGLVLPFAGPQSLSSDLASLSVYWTGSGAVVTLRDPSGQEIASAKSSDTPFATLPLDDLEWTASEVILELASDTGTRSEKLLIVAATELPRPYGVGDLAMMSEAERAIYAIWLGMEGPQEFRLQGISLLAEAAETDYAAWKVLLALRSGAVE